MWRRIEYLEKSVQPEKTGPKSIERSSSSNEMAWGSFKTEGGEAPHSVWMVENGVPDDALVYPGRRCSEIG